MRNHKNNFCTYFDHNYLPYGLTLYGSLAKNCNNFHLFILCLNETCYDFLLEESLENVTLIKVDELEKWSPDLLIARSNRNIIEYYFTLTPCLTLYILEHVKEVRQITYLDSDLFFFSSPQPLFDDIGQHSIAIIPHFFSYHLKDSLQHGIFNVGWITFANDDIGLECLRWWKEKCVEWCYDIVEETRFADQKYLNRWPDLFPDVYIINHKGANTAPWNIDRYSVTEKDGDVYIDEDKLVFFHFVAFKPVNSKIYDTGLTLKNIRYKYKIRRLIYLKYHQELSANFNLVRHKIELAIINRYAKQISVGKIVFNLLITRRYVS